MALYTGKTSDTDPKAVSVSVTLGVVKQPVSPHFGQCHILFTHSYCSSPTVADRFSANQTGFCGTCNANRTGMPHDIRPSNMPMQKEDDPAFRRNGLKLACTWQDINVSHSCPLWTTTHLHLLMSIPGLLLLEQGTFLNLLSLRIIMHSWVVWTLWINGAKVISSLTDPENGTNAYLITLCRLQSSMPTFFTHRPLLIKTDSVRRFSFWRFCITMVHWGKLHSLHGLKSLMTDASDLVIFLTRPSLQKIAHGVPVQKVKESGHNIVAPSATSTCV